MYIERIQKLQNLMEKAGLDAVALNPGPSMVYFSGLHFHLSERPTLLLVPAVGKPALILPQLESGKAEGLEFTVQTFLFVDNPTLWWEAYRDAVINLLLDHADIGVESTSIRYLELDLLDDAAPGTRITAASELISDLRMIKDAQEVAWMRDAVRVAQDGLRDALRQAKMGMTERELANELVIQLLRHGSDPALPFMPIIASGPNGANPHAVPSDRKLQSGDLVVIDWGASVNGYYSDLTRTFAVGDVEKEYHEIVRITAEANAAGRGAAAAGVPISQVDKAARSVITSAGYGSYFTHRTGHGLGMETHEEPYCYGENTLVLKPGMTFTVEPGIYLPNRNGTRVEDNIVITASGCDCLSDMDRALVQIL